jgi:pyruvyltransferase
MKLIVKAWGAEALFAPKPTKNWGDAVNRELVQIIAGPEYSVELVEAIRKIDVLNFLVVGSILKYADDSSVIWGSGFLEENERCRGNPTVNAVRGPKTREKLLKLGIACPEIYGDPGLLFQRFYRPKIEKKYKLGIVLHWRDSAFHPIVKALSLPEGVLKIRHDVGSCEFVNMICSCERIASSSLHGIIVADSYGVPNVQLMFHRQSMFKYEDYAASVDKHPTVTIDCDKEFNVNKIMDSFVDYNLKINLDKLMKACPFIK